jgi:hypothetical protein
MFGDFVLGPKKTWEKKMARFFSSRALLRGPVSLFEPLSQARRELFLRLVCVAYAAAFYAAFVQLPHTSLSTGVEPAAPGGEAWAAVADTAGSKLQGAAPRSLLRRVASAWIAEPVLPRALVALAPNLAAAVSLDLDMAQELACAAALVAAVLGAISSRVRTVPLFVFLHIAYAGVMAMGGTFYHFQWDILLLEIGLVCVVLARWPGERASGTACPRGPVLLARLVLFKLILCAGVVKLQSRCPTWVNLTALEHHYATQPIPNAVAWYAHVLVPKWLHSVSVAATLIIEIPVAVLVLWPSRHARATAAAAITLLMALIALTGSYNFFNFLTAAMCVPLLTGGGGNGKGGNGGAVKRPATAKIHWLVRIVRTLLGVAAPWIALLLAARWLFALNTAALWGVSASSSRATLSQSQLPVVRLHRSVDEINAAIDVWLPRIAGAFAIPACAYAVLDALVANVAFFRSGSGGAGSPLSRISLLLATAWRTFASGLVITLVLANMVPLSRVLSSPAVRETAVARIEHRAYSAVQFANSVHSYGLFRSMTGVDNLRPDGSGTTARPEVVIEASADGGTTWTEIEIPYKPGDPRVRPAQAAPYQPRIAWQMWFLALGSYQTNPWFVHLAIKILAGDREFLRSLYGDDVYRKQYPFAHNGPPNLVRAWRYKYTFNRDLDSGAWWARRENSREEFLPPVDLKSVGHIFNQFPRWKRVGEPARAVPRWWQIATRFMRRSDVALSLAAALATALVWGRQRRG